MRGCAVQVRPAYQSTYWPALAREGAFLANQKHKSTLLSCINRDVGMISDYITCSRVPRGTTSRAWSQSTTPRHPWTHLYAADEAQVAGACVETLRCLNLALQPTSSYSATRCGLNPSQQFTSLTSKYMSPRTCKRKVIGVYDMEMRDPYWLD